MTNRTAGRNWAYSETIGEAIEIVIVNAGRILPRCSRAHSGVRFVGNLAGVVLVRSQIQLDIRKRALAIPGRTLAGNDGVGRQRSAWRSSDILVMAFALIEPVPGISRSKAIVRAQTVDSLSQRTFGRHECIVENVCGTSCGSTRRTTERTTVGGKIANWGSQRGGVWTAKVTNCGDLLGTHFVDGDEVV